MDDVLDSVCLIHMHGDVYRRLLIMVPLLLRGEDSASPVASLASDEGILDSLQEVCASSTLQERTGNFPYEIEIRT